ncbi:I78 family peptidase inhibitor [Pseudomonas sp.]|uniref:I78 family peptidase inhibitor n=1 Tax=Pseudomonas sp. TaxID=306 RepID=UPI003A987F04
MQLKHLAGLALIASLSACSSMDGGSSDTASDTAAAVASDRFKDKCNAEAVQDMLGQRVTPALSKQIKEKAGAKSVRVLGPTDPMTMDYKSSRLNIDTDEAEIIDRITCG